MKITIQDWIALVGVIVGGLALVLSILVAVWGRQDRLLDARRAAYADLWTACDVHRREVEAQVTWRRDRAFRSTGDDPGIGSSEPARRALIAIQLVSRDDVVKAAAGLYSATVSLGARFHYDAKDPFPTPLDVPAWNQALKSRDEAAGAFQAIAAKDVGKPT